MPSAKELLSLPNLLSLSRVVLAVAMYLAVVNSQWYLAVSILWIAVFTDILDGYLARAFHKATPLGGVFDHGSDAIFVTVTIAAHLHHGWAPALLVMMIPAAFLQYMLDSKALAGQPLRASSLGRYNGISYFVFAGFPVMQLALNVTLIPFDWFIWFGWGLVMTTAVSMLDRLVTLLASRRAGGRT